ncbi:MAG: exodeoxyribonuclease VII large subunit [Lachnospiraceae bacterium]|nr:exodeoxyribonuclease VII large subunit [Lachnospiraceae bacterium]
MPVDPPCYSVGQISSYIKGLFEQDFLLKSVQVEGEISNLKYHSSGHIYFTLKDEKAAIGGIMFANYARSLKIRLRDGMKVRVSGSISTYERGSSYQIYAKSIAEAGLGVLYQRFMETKQRLEEMGLFDPAYRKPIPQYAMRIGVVTAPTGAAIQDIVNITHRRNPFAQLILYPALVQGEYAPASIIKGIETLDRMGLDVLIVGRGGGSLEDLWAFNEEAVARAIFDADTPVISAVGHETDVTIADYVADLRAPTPSAAAELAVFDVRAYADAVRQKRQRLASAVNARFEQKHLLLSHAEARLRRYDPRARMNEYRLRTAYAQDNLDNAVKRRLEASKQGLSEREKNLQSGMEEALSLARERLDTALYSLRSDMETAHLSAVHRLDLSAARLDGLSPLKRLGSGYAFAEAKGRALTDSTQVTAGDRVKLYLKQGHLLTEVIDPEETDHE